MKLNGKCFLPILAVSGALIICSCSSKDSSYSLQPEPTVRVLLADTMQTVDVTPTGQYNLILDDQVYQTDQPFLISLKNGLINAENEDFSIITSGSMVLDPVEEGLVTIKNVPYGVGWWWEGIQERMYEGLIEINVVDDQIHLITELPIEEYLRGVVPSEIGPTAHPEALKAQAVAARSETVTALRERVYAGDNYDICADVDCQVYAGIGKRNDATDAAIQATRGLVIAHDGLSLPAYYASNSGGFTENVENVWPHRDRGIPAWTGKFDGIGDPPPDLTVEENVREWVTTAPAHYANQAAYPGLPDWTLKNFRWEKEVTAEELTGFVAKKKDIGRVIAMEPMGRGVSGRLTNLKFIGENGEYTTGPELAIRQMWEPPLKSSCFVVTPIGDESRPDSFLIQGAGYGHGVGMCQTGAMARALTGQNFEEILTFYYTGVDVIPAYQ